MCSIFVAVSWQRLTSQFTTSSHHIAQPHCITTTSQHVPSYHITSHHIISSHLISSHLATNHMPHDMIQHHITTHHIATIHTPRKHNHQTERLKAAAHKKLGLGNALIDGPTHILSANSSFGLNSFSFWNLCPRLVQVLLVYFYKDMMLVAWMPDSQCGICQERLPPPNLDYSKHSPKNLPFFYVQQFFTCYSKQTSRYSMVCHVSSCNFPPYPKIWEASYPHQLCGTGGITTRCGHSSEPGVVEVKSQEAEGDICARV